MKKKAKRRHRCESCKQLKHDVKRVEDPCMKDVCNETVIKDLCESCIEQSAQEI